MLQVCQIQVNFCVSHHSRDTIIHLLNIHLSYLLPVKKSRLSPWKEKPILRGKIISQSWLSYKASSRDEKVMKFQPMRYEEKIMRTGTSQNKISWSRIKQIREGFVYQCSPFLLSCCYLLLKTNLRGWVLHWVFDAALGFLQLW